ncbi:hypothetical protein [Campylobacter suis]|uniref:Pyridoxamine 5'-phosphate oxidase putative domain-containing protein n=1 Tax=Campylobacter suis TaxID=2790657 RepID=A0ABN7K8K7_9BACT|nr:hypothetical protein [Campylobacter suis]CAD7288859.1 hypothetical protein LMG8286_01560 [Campylobacter suis]
MLRLDERILKFLYSRQLLSLCVLDDMAKPYAFSAFYAFSENEISLVFASSDGSAHTQFMSKNNIASGTIALDTKIVAKIEGVQFCGEILRASDTESKIYFKKFAYAKIMDPTLYALKIEWLKYTNNTLGFGKKISWNRGV